jgi:hypothetical protein
MKENVLSRIWCKALRTAYAVTGMRPTSYPYISGDGFRAIARHVYDAQSTFKPNRVRKGEIVFVESALIDQYFAAMHKLITNRYILITHNGDTNIGLREITLIDDKIIRWFAQNVTVEHPRLTPIPIGLENARLVNAGRTSLIRSATRHIPRKNGRILVAFTPHTNPTVRTQALEELRANPLADIRGDRMSQREYFETLKTYSYVASPAGNGEDCHRTWEALYAQTTPIVQPSVCMKYFTDIGVPVLIQESWRNTPRADLADFPVQDPKTSPIFFTYWKRIISECAENPPFEKTR